MTDSIHRDLHVPGLLPAEPRQGGFGPATSEPWSSSPYHHPAAAWGAARSVSKVLISERELFAGTKAMLEMNHPVRGFDCPGCAWPDSNHGVKLDICENGIKHVTWEMTHKRADADFFARHTVSELSRWTDFDLEDAGRLTEPLVYDASSDRYVPISWDDAFALVGDELRALGSPDEAAFYTSGRLSNEATFLYQLWVREFGTNNLPDCSNMCHEASGRALTASIATGKGTVSLDDWDACDALFVFGVNAASNAPRMLTSLAHAVKRGAQVVHINPMKEVASTRTIVPHEVLEMARFHSTDTGTMDVQVRPGGDLALMRGVAKAVFEAEDRDPGGGALDHAFLERFTSGFEEYRALVDAASWDELTRQAGVDEETVRALAQIYLDSPRSIVSWCLGVTQHEHGVDTVREFMNVLLLRGNIGREGSGPSPVRGHSNVQGNRTCGIDHRPKEPFLAALDAEFGISSPRAHGLDTVQTVAGMNDGTVKVFVALGGNFVLAAPDTTFTAQGLTRCELTVQVSTKLNRSHLVHGRKALILPCLGRTEKDVQAGGPQGVSCEDAMSNVQLSAGKRRPASPHLRSELAILGGMARATLPASTTPWEEMVADYDRIRDAMARVLPGFEGFNELVRRPLGFRIPQAARERIFHTPSRLAEFSHAPTPDVVPSDPDVLVLQTMRSHDQWNTTIYSSDDRYRGVKNLRELVFMNADDMADRGLTEGQFVDIVSTSKDGSQRSLCRYRAIAYDLPRGAAAGYMPEMNALIGAADYSVQSDQPLMKNVKVRITAS
ncbi:formate dehydrogenase subunit alpha [Gordonia spumicola]|uniref:Formate dehydrogenase subunit alpha n=1 Tax=Gordonia spumicola TaxID=589161 RepID=A0A7I9VCM1_9ACTN|nr:FdhF/YdeP family oxidoreductase [Gordonia spumicola]GEE03119.1 formate dehydrogenase subunit alpha [Gordonia spumicola]